MSTLKVNNLQDLGADAVVTNGVIEKAALPSGSILQVVSTIKTNTFSTSTSNALEDVTGLSATITPSSTANKVLVTVSLSGMSSSNRNGYAVVLRDSTSVAIGDAGGSRPRATINLNNPSGGTDINNSMVAPTQTVSFLDSPNTTSAVTYKVQVFASTFVSSNIINVNRTTNDNDDVRGVRSVSSVTLMEVAG